MLRKILLIILLLTMATAYADTSDTVGPDSIHLYEVTVEAHRRADDVIPAQSLSGTALQRLNSQSVADAMRYFAGVQVKDYGGVGGVKTINVRSMGTNHTGVVYDGVQLGNAQNGQIDLGQFSLDNIEALSLYNGQKSMILQTARDFGNAGTVYLRTRRPEFAPGERFHLRAMVRTGSFDVINPSALFEMRLSRRVSASLSAEWLSSSGKYRFRYRRVSPDGTVAYDTTAVRQNGDIRATRFEFNLHGSLTRGGWRAKAYTYNSKRGVPGAIVNNVWRRGERIGDSNTFVQGEFDYNTGLWSTLVNAKYAYYRTHYVNNDDRQLHVDNRYCQQELYLSWANELTITRHIHASAAYDLTWNTLETDIHGFVRPDRITNMVSVAAAYDHPQVRVQASGLYTGVHDMLSGRQSPRDRSVFTPAAYVSVTPVRGLRELQLRAFYKRSFRMPTFNDLYYADMGNSSLAPERVTQYNIGATWDYARRGSLLSGVRATADGYYNRVKDKIVAYPKGTQFRWTMLNLGLVDIHGVDLTAAVTLSPLSDLDITLRGQYTWQRAIDVTSPADSYYRDQIPYIPHHSGSAVVSADWRGWGLNYSYIYVGERYSQPENIRSNRMPAWNTSDLSLQREFGIRAVRMRVQLDINNLFNRDYAVILNYPMPRRNYRLTLVVSL